MPARTRSASNTDVVSFTLHSKISKGAAGSIWSATVVLPNGSQACRAAKVIESEGDGDNLVDAKREIKALQMLEHCPEVVSLKEFFHSECIPYVQPASIVLFLERMDFGTATSRALVRGARSRPPCALSRRSC